MKPQDAFEATKNRYSLGVAEDPKKPPSGVVLKRHDDALRLANGDVAMQSHYNGFDVADGRGQIRCKESDAAHEDAHEIGKRAPENRHLGFAGPDCWSPRKIRFERYPSRRVPFEQATSKR